MTPHLLTPQERGLLIIAAALMCLAFLNALKPRRRDD